MESDALLPELINGLALIIGPKQSDGMPVWIIFDTQQEKLFEMDWASFELLKCWGSMSFTQLLELVKERNWVYADALKLNELICFLDKHKLLEKPLISPTVSS